jgi:predicted RNA binding protein YcfA (HicA-like mRNA interferase family)
MSKIDKLVAKLKARPPELEFADVEKVLDAYGWQLRRRAGSHVSYRKPGDPRLLTIATVSGKTVKTTYLDMICDYLGLDE